MLGSTVPIDSRLKIDFNTRCICGGDSNPYESLKGKKN